MIDSNKFITVFTDASFCPFTKAGGIAVWIKYGAFGSTLRFSRGIKRCTNASNLEYTAMKHITSVLTQNNVNLVDKIVVIQSDCTSAIQRFEGSGRYRWILKLAKMVKLKHVKAHQGYGDARSAVNSWCDEAAKAEMRIIRAEVRKEKAGGR